MATTGYNYAITDTADDTVDSDKLTAEITGSSIATALQYISTDVDGDWLGIFFVDPISGGDQTTLDGIVAAHVGTDLTVEPTNLGASGVPDANNDGSEGYRVGSYWVDSAGNTAWLCVDATEGAAVWLQVSNRRRDFGNSATDPAGVNPDDGDVYYNTALDMPMRYDATRAKWLSEDSTTFQFGRSAGTGAGSFYRGINGLVLSATTGYVAKYNGTIVGFGYTRGDSDAATFEVTADGSAVATLASSANAGKTTSLNANISEDDVIALRNQAGGNTTSGVQAWVEIRWRP